MPLGSTSTTLRPGLPRSSFSFGGFGGERTVLRVGLTFPRGSDPESLDRSIQEFERARGHREERSLLRKLQTRISKIRVFDPACGSGNFLIIAYRELRTLEMRIFQRMEETEVVRSQLAFPQR